MYNRFLYQRSSDFGRRWPSPRTSLCPYKDSSSAPFYPMPPRGATSRHLFAPFSPSTNPPSTNRLPAPILFPTLRTTSPKHLLPPYRQPFPQTAPPSSPPYYSLHTLHRVHIWDTYHPYTSLSHREYTPSTSDPRTSPPNHLQRALRGTQYARGSVHTCTVMYTRVYNRAFIPISF